jgi:hypothetical protein
MSGARDFQTGIAFGVSGQNMLHCPAQGQSISTQHSYNPTRGGLTMKHFTSICCSLVVLAALPAQWAFAHPGHVHDKGAKDSHHTEKVKSAEVRTITLAQNKAEAPAAQKSAPGITGDGDLKFKLLYKADHLPAEALAVLVKAHGGFAYDTRPGKGEIYFALPGAGIIQISADLKQTKMLPTDPAMRDSNMHNANIWYAKNGTPYLIFPGNDTNKVFTTTIDGTLVNTLSPPAADFRFDAPAVNTYFQNPDATKSKFIPTDVAQLNGLYYIPTGYSSLDYVLTAKVDAGSQLNVTWNTLSFGGKGSGPGEFGTGHGITITPDSKRIAVADRPNSQIDYFSPDGKYLETTSLPAGSLPCDTFFSEGYITAGCLDGPDKTKGAPIYIVKDGKVVSTINVKDDLGLENFTHVHNAIMVKVGDKLYVIAQAWNPGDFAILEQVK